MCNLTPTTEEQRSVTAPPERERERDVTVHHKQHQTTKKLSLSQCSWAIRGNGIGRTLYYGHWNVYRLGQLGWKFLFSVWWLLQWGFSCKKAQEHTTALHQHFPCTKAMIVPYQDFLDKKAQNLWQHYTDFLCTKAQENIAPYWGFPL